MGSEEPVDADTVFQLASFSKPMAAATVAAIVGGGTITWDSRIADIDPGFRLYDPYPSAELTIRDLFSHRSGLPGLAGVYGPKGIPIELPEAEAADGRLLAAALVKEMLAR